MNEHGASCDWATPPGESDASAAHLPASKLVANRVPFVLFGCFVCTALWLQVEVITSGPTSINEMEVWQEVCILVSAKQDPVDPIRPPSSSKIANTLRK